MQINIYVVHVRVALGKRPSKLISSIHFLDRDIALASIPELESEAYDLLRPKTKQTIHISANLAEIPVYDEKYKQKEDNND